MATPKKNFLKLDILQIEDYFFENVVLLGISSDKPIYTLCHFINEVCSLQFERQPHLDIEIGKKKEAFKFAIYQSRVPNTDEVFTFYKLRNGDVHLLPSIKNVDYIWMINGDDAEESAAKYLTALREMPEVQFATLLDKDKINNIEYLIL